MCSFDNLDFEGYCVLIMVYFINKIIRGCFMSKLVSLPVENIINGSVFEDGYKNVGKGFSEILSIIDNINKASDTISVVDTLQLQQAVFKYTMHQEIITKIAAKSANSINEVMKAQ